MGTAIYARTCTSEKLHNTTRIKNQVQFCHQIASAHNLAVEEGFVFTDVEEPGDAWPTCWGMDEDVPSRPALSSLIEAIESGTVDCLLVQRMDVLGTSSEILKAIADMLDYHHVHIVVIPDQLDLGEDDYGERFALSMLRRCIEVDSSEERKRVNELRLRKKREIDRLKARLKRMEAELAELDSHTGGV